MLKTGNVVKIKNNLYIVSEVKIKNHRIDLIELIHIDNSACSTIISRKNPRKKKIYNQECIDGTCEHEYDEMFDYCPYEKVIDPDFHIDNIKYVADNVQEHIMRKIKFFLFTE